MLEVVTQFDVAGAGWGGGVFVSPWWKVDPPYTPIGYAGKRQSGASMRRTRV